MKDAIEITNSNNLMFPLEFARSFFK